MGTAWAVHPCDHVTNCCCPVLQQGILILITTLKKIKIQKILPKNWYFQIVVLEKTLEHPLDRKEIKPVIPKGNRPWILFGTADAEAEAPILWPLDAKNWLTGKEFDTGKDWRQEEKRVAEDEKVEWHHWFNGHEFEQLQEIVKDRGGLWVGHTLATEQQQQCGIYRMHIALTS